MGIKEHRYAKIVFPLMILLFVFLFTMNGITFLYSQPRKTGSNAGDESGASDEKIELKTYVEAQEDIEISPETVALKEETDEDLIALEELPRAAEEDYEIGEVKPVIWGEEEKAAEEAEKDEGAEAVEAVKGKITEMDRIRAEDHSNIAVRLYMMGEVDKAIEFFEKALEIDPSNIGIRYNYATTYRNLGVKDKAVEQYEKILEIDPGFELAQSAIDSIKSGDGSAAKTEEKVAAETTQEKKAA